MPLPKPGDVFAIRHPRGFFGAVRVLRKRAGEYLLACSTYLERKPPLITDPRLRTIQRQTEISWEGKPSVHWTYDSFPRTWRPLGSIAPTAREARRDSKFWCGWEGAGIEAWWAWRFRHERAKFERELNRDAARERREEIVRLRRARPKAMMAEGEFWDFIALIVEQGSDRNRLVQLIRALAEKSGVDIRRYHERLVERLYRLDTREHARRMKTGAWRGDGARFSPDGFLYARCGCVARGREFYDRVRKQPGLLARATEFEALLDTADLAHRRKTGRSLSYQAGLSFESCSNLAGWPG